MVSNGYRRAGKRARPEFGVTRPSGPVLMLGSKVASDPGSARSFNPPQFVQIAPSRLHWPVGTSDKAARSSQKCC